MKFALVNPAIRRGFVAGEAQRVLIQPTATARIRAKTLGSFVCSHLCWEFDPPSTFIATCPDVVLIGHMILVLSGVRALRGRAARLAAEVDKE